jgi:hypothetical protein
MSTDSKECEYRLTEFGYRLKSCEYGLKKYDYRLAGFESRLKTFDYVLTVGALVSRQHCVARPRNHFAVTFHGLIRHTYIPSNRSIRPAACR